MEERVSSTRRGRVIIKFQPEGKGLIGLQGGKGLILLLGGKRSILLQGEKGLYTKTSTQLLPVLVVTHFTALQ